MSDYSPTQQQQNFSQSSAFAAALQRAKEVRKRFFHYGIHLENGEKLKFLTFYLAFMRSCTGISVNFTGACVESLI